MIKDLLVTLSFLSMPVAIVIVVGGAAQPFLETPGGAAAREAALAKASAATVIDWTAMRTAYERNCAACHGTMAQGGDRGPSLIAAPIAAGAAPVPAGHRPRIALGQPETRAVSLFLERMRAANGGA